MTMGVFGSQQQLVGSSDMDRDDLDVVEATLSWGDNVLETKHFAMGARITIGEAPECDFMIPVEVLGSTSIDLAAADGRTGPTHVQYGAFAVSTRVVPAGRHVAASVIESVKESALGSIGGSAFLHAAIFASLVAFMPSLSADDSEALDRDHMFQMQVLLNSAAEREKNAPPPVAGDDSPATDTSSGGARAENSEGAMGRPDVQAHGRWSEKGDAKPQDVTFAREHEKAMAANFGLIGLLSQSSLSDPNAPVAPWGTVAVGSDSSSHMGDLWSNDIGDATGTGLGLTGPGEGGGGTGQGVGMNDLGGLGRSLDSRLGSGACMGPGPCTGNGHDRLRPNHVPKGPSVRPEPLTHVDGTLPAEVIQRIVRQNQGRFRNCYEAGLRTNPSLTGRVAVKFIIDREGAVSIANDGGSDIPDKAVTSCVVQSFFSLAFPKPANGQVRVTYPIMFTPGE